MKLALLALSLIGCAKNVGVLPPPSVAYRITRTDGAVLIVQNPGGATLEKLRDEFCVETTCMIEPIRLRPEVGR